MIIDLRDWQVEAYSAYDAHHEDSFLTVATPGAGKTFFGLVVGLNHLKNHPTHKIVVVTPTSSLRSQWARSASLINLNIEPGWDTQDLYDDVRGHAITYAQLTRDFEAIAEHADRLFVILDEIHHAGQEKSWGDALLHAFGSSPQRLLLSGTPMRSDNNPIPFVHYDKEGTARADYSYGYGEAIHDHTVRPVNFVRIGGRMEWIDHTGAEVSATFAEPLDTLYANQRLRTALDPEGSWLPSVLRQAHHRLTEEREVHPNAGGLVIARDQHHARAIANVLTDISGQRPETALSDDPQANTVIVNFANSDQPWIVAVRMVSEGVDIPRLRVGVYATNTLTELFFRQAVGRVVRATGDIDPAWFFIPNDPRLRHYAEQVEAERNHQLIEAPEQVDERTAPTGEGAAPSQYLAVSAIVDGHELTVTAPSAELAELRYLNKQAQAHIAGHTGRPERQVVSELNRRSNVRSIAHADLPDLRRRLDVANQWLEAVS
jgi:superfamily II DNA or RNA helicase